MSAPTNDELETAAEWIEDIDCFTVERRDAFLAWLGERPSHLVAAQRIWALLGDGALDTALREIGRSDPPLPVAAPVELADQPHPRRMVRWGVAAALLAACLVGIAGAGPSLFAPIASKRFATARAQAVTERLADGSVAHLDPDSTLLVTLASDRRLLDLERGRALFQTARDPDRPFTVRAADVTATAIGTVFSVDRIGTTVTVRVEEGKVRTDNGTRTLLLTAGRGVRFEAGGAAIPIRFTAAATGEIAGDWLRADGDRLDNVVERLQRHSSKRISVDPAIAATAVTGRFRLADPETSVALIAEVYGLRIMSEQSGLRLTGT